MLKKLDLDINLGPVGVKIIHVISFGLINL